MNNICNICSGQMKLLLTSYYCPNDCDRISNSAPQNSTNTVKRVRCIDTSPFLGQPICLKMDKIYEVLKIHIDGCGDRFFYVDCCLKHNSCGGWKGTRFIEVND
jgi:hypothetical protein